MASMKENQLLFGYMFELITLTDFSLRPTEKKRKLYSAISEIIRTAMFASIIKLINY